MSETAAFEASAYKFNVWGSMGTAAAPARDLSEESIRLSYAQDPVYKQLTPSDKFSILVDNWKRESQFLSSTADMAALDAYQQIIQMGHDAISLLLRELEREPDYWFVALQTLAGANPVRAEEVGRLRLMTDAWLQWGREHHYI